MAMHIASSWDLGQKVREVSIDRRLYGQLLHAVLYMPATHPTAPRTIVQTQQAALKVQDREKKAQPNEVKSEPKMTSQPNTLSMINTVPKPKTV